LEGQTRQTDKKHRQKKQKSTYMLQMWAQTYRTRCNMPVHAKETCTPAGTLQSPLVSGFASGSRICSSLYNWSV